VVRNNKVIDLGARGDSGDAPRGMVEDLPVGTKLMRGQYTITSYLNSGGFGITYCAHDSLGRTVVIKECYPSIMCRRDGTKIAPRKPEYVVELSKLIEQFVSEAHALAALKHKNILHVHQVFEENDTAYMAIDFIDGPDLLDVIESAHDRLLPDEIVRITRRILAAIKYVHDKGMLHRDISPDNILIDEQGEPVLIDFGSARRSANVPGRVFSKVKFVKDGYSPQEFYIEGADQGTWSDLYSLAATIYHAITGKPPIDAQHRMSAAAQGKADPYVPLDGHHEGFPDDFLAALDHALAIFPGGRIQSADEWLDRIPTRPIRVLSSQGSQPDRRTRATKSPDEAAAAAPVPVALGDARDPATDADAPPDDEGTASIDLVREKPAEVEDTVGQVTAQLGDEDAEAYDDDPEGDDFEVDLTQYIDLEDGTGPSVSEPATDAETQVRSNDGSEDQDDFDTLETAIAATNNDRANGPGALDAAISRTLAEASAMPEHANGEPKSGPTVLPAPETAAASLYREEDSRSGQAAAGRPRRGFFFGGVAAAALLVAAAFALQAVPPAGNRPVIPVAAPDIVASSEPAAPTPPETGAGTDAPAAVSDTAPVAPQEPEAETSNAPATGTDTVPAPLNLAAVPLPMPAAPGSVSAPGEPSLAPTVQSDVTLPTDTAEVEATPALPGSFAVVALGQGAPVSELSPPVSRNADAVPGPTGPIPRPVTPIAGVAESGFAFIAPPLDGEPSAPALSTGPAVRVAALAPPARSSDETELRVDPVPPAPLPEALTGQILDGQIRGAHWDVAMPVETVLEQVRNANTVRIVAVTDTEVAARSGDWLAEGTVIYAFNGETLRAETDLSTHLLDALTVDPDGFVRATVRYRDAVTGRIDRGLLTVPVFRRIGLADGTLLDYRVIGDAWAVEVRETGGSGGEVLRPGDILLSERTTGIGIANEDALRAVFARLVEADADAARFVVERGGIEREVTVPLARLEAQ